MKRKWLAFGIILLFVGLAENPITGISSYRDDTTPPVTIISFNPSEPDGENGWYVSPVTVMLNATDNESEVAITKYRINMAPWANYTQPFNLTNDGNDIVIEYFSIDVAGNIEPVKNATVDIDQTDPIIDDYTLEKIGGNTWLIITEVSDKTSGVNRVEFCINDKYLGTVTEPPYYWIFNYTTTLLGFSIGGFIFHPRITEETVSFFAIIAGGHYIFDEFRTYQIIVYDNAGNWDMNDQPTSQFDFNYHLFIFQRLTFSNNYSGTIDRFFINAVFEEGPL